MPNFNGTMPNFNGERPNFNGTMPGVSGMPDPGNSQSNPQTSSNLTNYLLYAIAGVVIIAVVALVFAMLLIRKRKFHQPAAKYEPAIPQSTEENWTDSLTQKAVAPFRRI